jgi:hypothetical protein
MNVERYTVMSSRDLDATQAHWIVVDHDTGLAVTIKRSHRVRKWTSEAWAKRSCARLNTAWARIIERREIERRDIAIAISQVVTPADVDKIIKTQREQGGRTMREMVERGEMAKPRIVRKKRRYRPWRSE